LPGGSTVLGLAFRDPTQNGSVFAMTSTEPDADSLRPLFALVLCQSGKRNHDWLQIVVVLRIVFPVALFLAQHVLSLTFSLSLLVW
jgi:hypothetical protein